MTCVSRQHGTRRRVPPSVHTTSVPAKPWSSRGCGVTVTSVRVIAQPHDGAARPVTVSALVIAITRPHDGVRFQRVSVSGNSRMGVI